ncbi:thymidylate kinase-like isoform X2 [Zophobas morio]|uniref:thymidylate kinase-like isoform X2 n=1 Tax=Zophobas morio TaxID=2755281 RepID=UPI003082D36C
MMSTNFVARGAFIVLEGCDRCGKTTQSKLLLQKLQSKKIKAELINFPDRTTLIGQLIDKYLTSEKECDDRAIHLLFSANRWEKNRVIQAKLLSGVTLIVDRYAFSGVAYTSAKGYDFEWCKSPDVGLPKPDLVLFLEMSAESASRRNEYGEERYEHLYFQKAVREVYRKFEGPSWVIIFNYLMRRRCYTTIILQNKKCPLKSLKAQLL